MVGGFRMSSNYLFSEPTLPNGLFRPAPSVAQQPQILTGLPPKVPQHPTNRPPPPPYPGPNLASKLPNRIQSRARTSPSSSRRSMPPSQQNFGLPPRDSSTPMCGSGNSSKMQSNASYPVPSPIGFSRANSLANNKPGRYSFDENIHFICQTKFSRI